MTHKGLNLAFAIYKGDRLPDVADGDIIHGGNLAQMEAGTVLFAGVKDLTFENCNLVNVAIDKSWTVRDCNTFHGNYDPAAIFPDEKIAVEQAQKEAVKQVILDKYAAEFDKQLATAKVADIDPKTLEASVIAAVSAVAVEGKP